MKAKFIQTIVVLAVATAVFSQPEALAQTCVPPPANLVSWWAAEGSATDSIGTNNGTLINGVSFAAGKVGEAFSFNGNNQYVQVVDSPSLNPVNAITLEGWFYLRSFNSSSGIALVEKGGGQDVARQYELGMIQNGTNWFFRPHIWRQSGLANFPGNTAVQLNTWYHVAMTYDGTTLTLYVNGSVDGSLATSGSIVTSSNPLWIGGDPEGPWALNGLADEVSLYDRALTATEVQSIYNAGSAGKCAGSNPPSITVQPASQSVLLGSTASLSVIAAGSAPLSYQWSFDGTNIDGATTSALTLINVQTSDAGSYSVVVSNNYGSAASSNAVLTVNTPPFISTQPQNLAVLLGSPATFSVVAGGDSPLMYQWQFNNSILSGATNSSLTLSAVANSNAGVYQVLVSNPFGSVLSSNAVLQVNSPPVIFAQPADTTVTAGNNATFVVGVSGSQPLAYQWQFGGGSIAGATTSVLTLNNVQSTNAGNYSVIVTNAFGSVTSSNAELAVNPANCIAAPADLVAWWPAEGNSGDQAGTNHGVLMNGATYAPGEVGEAFSFNGNDQYVQVADSPSLNPTNAITLEGWFFLRAFNPSSGIVLAEKGGGGDAVRQYELGMVQSGANWYFRPHVWRPSGLAIFPGNTPVQSNMWYHVAMTYDGTNLTLYVNGSPDGNLAASGPIVTSTHPIWIGGDPEGPWSLDGLADEVSLYSRALSAAEIQAIYNAGSAGKCQPANPPTIFAQPANLNVIEGDNATFTVGAAGSAPLSYQWEFNGTNISGATDSALTLTSVQPANAGTYLVVVSNAVGSVTSSNALLTVSLPPSMVQVVSVTATSGIVTVPINLVAQGDENALGFSVDFNPGLLSFASVNLGSGAPGGSLIYNANLAGQGKLGIAISLPSNTNFVAGTQNVANVSFFVAALDTNRTTTVSFGSQPVLRQVVDSSANILAATYVGGTVSIPAVTNANFGIEGDVSPVPNGDGSVTIADWVQEGRFVAGLDIITNASLFQRADCAPRATLGDGQLTIADWVQVGRYALGLDPLTPAGGPSVPNGLSAPSGYGQLDLGRVLKIVPPASAASGQSLQVSVQLTAQGNENALGFSLGYDTNILSVSSVNAGANAVGALFNANMYQSANGKLGLALALPAGQAFSAGTQEVARITFIVSSAATNATSITFGSQPVLSQTADTGASILTTSYVNGTLAVTPMTSGPALQLALTTDKSGVVLSWPATAAGFNLESSFNLGSTNWSGVSASLVTNTNSISATVPITGTQQFFRLHHP